MSTRPWPNAIHPDATPGSADPDLRPLLGVDDVAQILGVPKTTLYRWHSLSTSETPVGPRAFRVGRHLRYALKDLHAYIEDLRSTAS